MKTKIKIFILSVLGRWLIQLLFSLNTIKIKGEEGFLKLLKSNKPIMICVWHGRLLFPSWYIRFKTTNLNAIASRHPDAEIMAQILKKWGYSLLRGSTKKGGKELIYQMDKTFKEGGIIAITNDGPKGPVRVAKLGSIGIALKNNANIITITGSCTKFWQMKSWDQFMLPKPFGTIQIVISESIQTSNINDLSNEQETITSFINKYEKIANNMVNENID